MSVSKVAKPRQEKVDEGALYRVRINGAFEYAPELESGGRDKSFDKVRPVTNGMNDNKFNQF